MHLKISVTFPNRRYHGRCSDNLSEERIEYPPSPTRLFQSLIAASHIGIYGYLHTAIRDRALQWLETLAPPVIEAPTVCVTGGGVINYVPNNDNGKKENRLEHVRTAKSFLNTAFPGDASLHYYWRFEENEEANASARVICAIASLMTHLGQHQDTVYASGTIEETSPAATPSFHYPHESRGASWTVPRPGTYHAYRERYDQMLQGVSKDNTLIPVRQIDYRPVDTITFNHPVALFELWRNEDQRLRYDPRDLLQPSGMTRHAMIEWLNEHPSIGKFYGVEHLVRLIAGHDGGKQYNGPHIACVPIPSLDDQGVADGLIRRVLLVGLGCQDLQLREIFKAVVEGINGMALRDRGRPIGFLKRGSIHDNVLRTINERPGKVWRTLTPIILTGMMRRGRAIEPLISRAMIQAGIDPDLIESIAAFSGPIVAQTVRALDYRIDRESYLSQTPRYHAEVIFKCPVKGTLIIGRGRHSGFGLMAPCLTSVSW
ncbi:MAG: type I-G CRISPR-associated protein Csb2 [Blastocatellia bacterium]